MIRLSPLEKPRKIQGEISPPQTHRLIFFKSHPPLPGGEYGKSYYTGYFRAFGRFNLTLERKRPVFTSVTFQTVQNSWVPLRIKINTALDPYQLYPAPFITNPNTGTTSVLWTSPNSRQKAGTEMRTVPSGTVSLLVALPQIENGLIDPAGLAKHHPSGRSYHPDSQRTSLGSVPR